MPARQKINSVVMVGVAVAFQWFFMFTKHDPGLRPVIPFGDDPYDALGSFASIVNIFLCLLLLWRSFRPYGGRLPSPVQIQYLRRTQAAVPLLILVTLAADAVAMARHPRMWIGSQDKLLALLAGMMVISSVAIWLVLSSMPEPRPPRRRKQMIAPAIAIALFLLILAFYPEHLIGRLFTHLVTVLIGDLLLFVPVSILLRFLLPDPQSSRGGARANARRFCAGLDRWDTGRPSDWRVAVPLRNERRRWSIASTSATSHCGIGLHRTDASRNADRRCLSEASSRARPGEACALDRLIVSKLGFSAPSDKAISLECGWPAILLFELSTGRSGLEHRMSRPVILRLSIEAMARED